jgi:hypothetical protein
MGSKVGRGVAEEHWHTPVYPSVNDLFAVFGRSTALLVKDDDLGIFA